MKKLLNLTEAAAKIGVSRQQVAKWIDQKRIPVVQISDRRYVEVQHAKKPPPVKPGPRPKTA